MMIVIIPDQLGARCLYFDGGAGDKTAEFALGLGRAKTL